MPVVFPLAKALVGRGPLFPGVALHPDPLVRVRFHGQVMPDLALGVDFSTFAIVFEAQEVGSVIKAWVDIAPEHIIHFLEVFDAHENQTIFLVNFEARLFG